MLNWKKTVLAAVLGGALIIPSATFAAEPNNNQTQDSFRTKIVDRINKNKENRRDRFENKKERLENRKEKFQKRREEMDAVINEGEKYSPGIKAQWDELLKQKEQLRTEFKEIRDSKRESMKEKNNANKEEVRSKIEAIKKQITDGTKTKEEGNQEISDILKSVKEDIGTKRESNKEKWEGLKDEHREEGEKLREDMQSSWKSLEEAVSTKDEAKIKEAFDEVKSNMNKKLDLTRERLEEIKSNQ